MAVDIYNFSELVPFIIIFILNIFIVLKFHSFFNISIYEAVAIYFWHSIFAFIFLAMDLNNNHDASGWYTRSNIESIGYFGNSFMYFFSGLMKSININYIAQNLIFNLMGSTTLIILYSKTKEFCKYEENKKFLPFFLILVFLPGLAFWSSGITKDTLSILAISVLYFSVSKKFNFYLFLFSLFLMFVSRPFLFFFFTCGLYIYCCLGIIFSKKIKFNLKFIGIIILLILIYPTVLTANISFVYISKVSSTFDFVEIIQSALKYIASSQAYYIHTNYGIPNDTNYLVRYFYFLYMPFVSNYHNFYSGYFILENVFLLFFTVLIVLNFKFNLKKINGLTKIFYISIMLMFIIFPLIFSNYGIALRYKWLVIPYLALAFLDLRKRKG